MSNERFERARNKSALAALVVVASCLVGCVTSTPGVDRLAGDLERDLGLDLERGVGVKAGRMSLGLARTIARASVDAEDEPEAIEGIRLLSGIKRVEVRQFEHDGELFAEQLAGTRSLERRLAKRGWTTVARVADEDQLAWVLVRFGRHESIRSAVVLGMDDAELNVVRLSGRLDQVLQEAMRLARQRVEEADDADFDDEQEGGMEQESVSTTASVSGVPGPASDSAPSGAQRASRTGHERAASTGPVAAAVVAS